jgi:hypothetical protein
MGCGAGRIAFCDRTEEVARFRALQGATPQPPSAKRAAVQWTGVEEGRVSRESAENAKSPLRRAGFSDANAGDYLISHTLTRAVPSARRGLTSVFGMGTGVTLAVNSPASLGAALGGRFPAAISCTHGRFLPGTRMANWRHKLAFKNELHWHWLQLQPVVEQGLLLSVL